MRYHKLDLNLLVIFECLLEERSVSKVARRLNLSQPTISNALARLRLHFDDELFRLVDRSMQPTDLALSIASEVGQILARLEAIAYARANFDPLTSDKTFTFVASDQAYLTVIIALIRALRVHAPGVKIKCSSVPDQGIALLRRGEVDFTLNPGWTLAKDMPHASLFKDEVVCVSWTKNRRVSDELTLDELCACGHIESSLRPQLRFIDRALAASGRSCDVAAWAPGFSLVMESIPGTEFLAVAGRRVAAKYAKRLPLRTHALPLDVPPIELMMQWNQAKESDPAIIWMREFVQRVVNEDADI